MVKIISPLPNLITVFGGTGFLGRAIVHRLVESGMRVRIVARHPRAPNLAGARGQIALQRADVRDEDSVAEALKGATGVVNAVGLYVEQGQATFRAIHEEGAERVARRAGEAGIRRLIHISGIGVDPASASKYARARAYGEQRVREIFPNATILRPSVMFGPNDAFLNSLKTVTRLPVVPLFGQGSTRLQPVYVEDVARAVLQVLEMPEASGKTFELGGARAYRYRDIIEQVLTHLSRRRLLLPVPFVVWRLLARIASLLPNAPLTLDQVILMETDNVANAKASTFNDLGIEPCSLEQMLSACLDELSC
ncbi:NAD-dependent epimerase/dehydratase [Nitrosococcus oceani ATCC 19707]|uniref:NAD-dependent epimerase/dehydratase n=2 Tax=Nitrosococcus oceani TaxID=1229 RepID=Q3JEV6_NITOC|nr:complex I NDUFA9 subunit family protein [Nitrosococcus oceani]ABA56640.1 NAD-dependent epimerase/dehydratase [Nitrosococcus oceani ATCC 19707]EDZ66295.1 3-beta hydroxysteroid dehydrogenase/isomerase family [Nitrosococcus oceani AFC27]KFI20885.1 epimerase [Nitrosococcus oceani C-27]